MENIRKLSINDVLEIIGKTNNQEIEKGKKGIGFWLFKKDIEKYPTTFTDNSPLKMNYFGLFDDDNSKCIALSAVSFDCPYSYNNYPCIIRIESTKNGAGIRMLNWLFYYLQKEGCDGVVIDIYNENYAESYKKMGFENFSNDPLYMQKTFKKYISDSVNESINTTVPIEKKIIEKSGKKTIIEYLFGKNGSGLTTELIEIGKDIDRYSKTNTVILSDPYFDVLDDLYSFYVNLYPLSEDDIAKKKKLGLLEWKNPTYKKNELELAEDAMTQLVYMLQDANESNDSDKILDTIYKINELIETPIFFSTETRFLFHEDDNEGIGNKFVEELSKAFKFIENRDIPDVLRQELATIKWELNQIIIISLMCTTPSKLDGNLRIIESYVSGVYGDPTFSTGYPSNRYDAGYKYNIRNLNHDFEGQKQKPTKEQTLIHVGSYIAGKDKNDDWVCGRIYRIDKDENGFIRKVWVFNKNGKIVNVNVDSVTAVPNGKEYTPKALMSYDDINSKYPIIESVKHNGKPIYFGLDGKKYILTLNEGEVVIGEIKNQKLISLESVYDINNNFANRIQKKILS